MGLRVSSSLCLGAIVVGLATTVVGIVDDEAAEGGPNLVIGGLSIAALGLIFLLALGLTRRAPTWKPGTKPWHATASIEIHRTRMEVWDFLQAPENVEVIIPAVERSFYIPRRPGDVIQLQATLLRLPNDDLVCMVEQLVHEQPGIRSEMRGVTGPPSHTVTELRDTPNGTLVSVEATQSTQVGAVQLINPQKALQTHLEEYLASAKRILENAPARPAST